MNSTVAIHKHIETIESAYEFMLAYAAQGYESDANQSHDVRTHLTAMDAALDELGSVVAEMAVTVDGEVVQQYLSFITALTADADKAQGAVRLVLSRAGISSQLVDNLNASIHLRALLTDLFLIDEAFK